MARYELHGARILLTGASSGIGRALARRLVQRGARLIVAARRRERLEALASEMVEPPGEIQWVQADVADAGDREQMLAAARTYYGGLDALINNAGVGAHGPFAKADEARMRRVMEVNFFAPVELIRLSLPLLREGRRPLVVNIGSVLGHRAVPNKSEYCASKFALHGFTESLRMELAPEGIDVLLVSPSTTKSEFFKSAIDSAGGDRSRPFGAMSPEEAARHTIRAMERRRREVVLSAGGKLLVWGQRAAPSLMDRILSRFASD